MNDKSNEHNGESASPTRTHSEAQKVSNLLRGKVNGIHIGLCKGRWYVFEFQVGDLRWCRAFNTESEARQCHRQRDAMSPAWGTASMNGSIAPSTVRINESA